VEYAVSIEGISALKVLSGSLRESIANISKAADELEGALELNRYGLGPHSVSIARLISDIRQEQQDACAPVAELSDIILDLAIAYQEFISEDRFAGNMNSGSGGGVLSGSGTGSSNPMIDNVNRIQGEHTAISDAKATNPSYSNELSPGEFGEYNHNCQRCVPAWEARRRGYDVSAKPVSIPDDLGSNWTGMYKDANPIKCTGNGNSDAIEQIGSWGEGARGEVKVIWEGTGKRKGHVFAVEVIDGKVHFIDPQTGDVDCTGYFNLVEPDTVEILRTDNLEFSERIKDCIRKV